MRCCYLGTLERSYSRGCGGGVCPGKAPQGPARIRAAMSDHFFLAPRTLNTLSSSIYVLNLEPEATLEIGCLTPSFYS